MLNRGSLSAEHAELGSLARDLLACVGEPEPVTERISKLRWAMSRKLIAHLAKEDGLLYPQLQGSADPRAAAIARRFAAEMGGLADSYRAYVTDWSTDRMTREWAAFGADTRRVMSALVRRIEREEALLYSLIPADARQGRWTERL